MTCIICWEEDLEVKQQQQVVVLQPCRHTACKACLKDWIQTCERQGHDAAACPHCRQTIASETCRAILQRPYRRKHKTVDEAQGDELDDFTATWLQENGARQCPHCGAWIVSEEESSGEPVMCLCGYCYCWNCDDCALDCDCHHEEIYDNVTQQDIVIDRDTLRVATEAEKRNFRAFLERRRNGEDDYSSDSNDKDEDEESVIIEEPAEADVKALFDFGVEVGTRGMGQWGKRNPQWYPCVVKAINPDGTIKVQWDEDHKFTFRLPLEHFQSTSIAGHVGGV